MAHTRRPQHPNAALTPTQRLKMVRLVGTAGAWPRRRNGSRSTTRQHASGSTATAARAKRAWGTAAAGPVTARGAPPSRNDSR